MRRARPGTAGDATAHPVVAPRQLRIARPDGFCDACSVHVTIEAARGGNSKCLEFQREVEPSPNPEIVLEVGAFLEIWHLSREPG